MITEQVNEIECSENCRSCSPDCQVLNACLDFVEDDTNLYSSDNLYRPEDWRQVDPEYPEYCWQMDQIRMARRNVEV